MSLIFCCLSVVAGSAATLISEGFFLRTLQRTIIRPIRSRSPPTTAAPTIMVFYSVQKVVSATGSSGTGLSKIDSPVAPSSTPVFSIVMMLFRYQLEIVSLALLNLILLEDDPPT